MSSHDCRTTSRAAVEELLVSELGAPVHEVFAEFDWEPIAAASIGQAYRARLHQGDRVIVKVQRPGIAETVERDVDVVHQLGAMLLGIKGGPDFSGQTTLYQLFGYFGLFCSTVLVMRVLVAILRDGLN